MTDRSEEWEQVGGRVRARMTQLAMTPGELAKKAALSREALRPIIQGKANTRRASTLEKISVALGWTPDSIERVLSGGDPELGDVRGVEGEDPAEQAFMQRVLEAMRAEIAEGSKFLTMATLMYVAGAEAWLSWWEQLGPKDEVPDFDELAAFLYHLPSIDEFNEAARLSVSRALARRRQEGLRAVADTGDPEGARGSEPRRPEPPAED